MLFRWHEDMAAHLPEWFFAPHRLIMFVAMFSSNQAIQTKRGRPGFSRQPLFCKTSAFIWKKLYQSLRQSTVPVHLSLLQMTRAPTIGNPVFPIRP